MSDPTSKVIVQLDWLDSHGESYSLGPFREGLPPTAGVNWSGRFAQCNPDILRSAMSWARVGMAYNAMLSLSLTLAKNTEEQQAQDCLQTCLRYIQHYISQLQRGEYGYTPEEIELMERWNAQPRRYVGSDPVRSDGGQEGEEGMESVD